MNDYIVRATAANAQIRAFAATTKNLVEFARNAHGTSPVATAALGRLLTAGAMMGSMLKDEDDLLTLQIKGDGPLHGVTVTADSKARVKGYVDNPQVMLPPNAIGKLDVGGAVGHGILALCRKDGITYRRNCRRPDLLFCNFRADPVFRRSGCPDGKKQYRQAGRWIYYPADAFC